MNRFLPLLREWLAAVGRWRLLFALATAIGLASVLALLAALISAQRVRHGTPPARPSA